MHVSATRGVDYLGNRVVPSTNDSGAIDCSLDRPVAAALGAKVKFQVRHVTNASALKVALVCRRRPCNAN
jgi:hypothetical protein